MIIPLSERAHEPRNSRPVEETTEELASPRDVLDTFPPDPPGRPPTPAGAPPHALINATTRQREAPLLIVRVLAPRLKRDVAPLSNPDG